MFAFDREVILVATCANQLINLGPKLLQFTNSDSVSPIYPGGGKKCHPPPHPPSNNKSFQIITAASKFCDFLASTGRANSIGDLQLHLRGEFKTNLKERIVNFYQTVFITFIAENDCSITA